MGYFITAKDKDKGTISGNGIFYSKTSVGLKGRKCTFDIHIKTLNTKPETRVTINANVEVWGSRLLGGSKNGYRTNYKRCWLPIARAMTTMVWIAMPLSLRLSIKSVESLLSSDATGSGQTRRGWQTSVPPGLWNRTT